MTAIYNPFLRKTISVTTDLEILRINLGITKTKLYLAKSDHERHELQAKIDAYEEVLAQVTQPRE